MRLRSILVLAALGAAGSAIAGGTPPADGCFTRTYDAAHLARHPGQATQSVVAALRRDELRLTLAGPARTLRVAAGCGWQARAGRDIAGKPLIPAFKGGAGYDCIVTTGAASAEEGGYLILTPSDGGVTIYLDSPVAARAMRGGKAVSTVLGAEDRVFKLRRANAGACAALAD